MSNLCAKYIFFIRTSIKSVCSLHVLTIPYFSNEDPTDCFHSVNSFYLFILFSYGFSVCYMRNKRCRKFFTLNQKDKMQSIWLDKSLSIQLDEHSSIQRV